MSYATREQLMNALSSALRDGKLFQVVRGLRQIQLAKEEELHSRWQQMVRAQQHEGAAMHAHHERQLGATNPQTVGRVRYGRRSRGG